MDLDLSTEQPFTEVATPTWRDLGSCRESPVDFFPFAEDAQAIRLAKDVGDLCPVIDDCLAYPIETRQSDGVWSGLTPKERLYLRRRWIEHNRTIAEMKRETSPKKPAPRAK
jgi:WhiB family redox-sensing transcriptional regulator